MNSNSAADWWQASTRPENQTRRDLERVGVKSLMGLFNGMYTCRDSADHKLRNSRPAHARHNISQTTDELPRWRV